MPDARITAFCPCSKDPSPGSCSRYRPRSRRRRSRSRADRPKTRDDPDDGPPLQHHLLTVQISASARVHGYLMAPDRRYVVEAGERMVAAAEANGCIFPLLRMILTTPLPSGDVAVVREIAGRCIPVVKRLLATATDYHFSAWTVSVDDPDDVKLMALH